MTPDSGLTGEVIERWYPDNTGDHNPFWGRAGDGLCHAFKTRSGSASVMNRNWHPGPMGHQIFQDRLSFFCEDLDTLSTYPPPKNTSFTRI